MKNVIVLLGPTGVGKTAAALALAELLGTEIISADSMQVYRGMDIGTAKPTAEEQTRVRHHLIDVVPPSGSFSAGEYIAAVRPLIDAFHTAGKIPLVVGGTGFYIRAMTRGLFAGPSADEELRSRLLAMEDDAPGTLTAMLGRLDPEAAGRIAQNDLRRTVRAIEVAIASGRSITDLQREGTDPLPYRFLKVGLMRTREELYRIIDSRVDTMIADGLIEEVERLLAASAGKTPLQAIGYKEIASFLKGEISREEAVRLVKRNSRRYARRQLIWFRKEEDIHWIDVTGIMDGSIICRLIAGRVEQDFGLRIRHE